MKRVKSKRFKKSNHVYAVVGGACCNSGFRRQLFAAYDPHNIEPLRKVVNDFLGATNGRPPVSQADLLKVRSFVERRRIRSRSRLKSLTREEFTFEAACDAFSASVCPHWPCDDYEQSA